MWRVREVTSGKLIGAVRVLDEVPNMATRITLRDVGHVHVVAASDRLEFEANLFGGQILPVEEFAGLVIHLA